MLLVLAGCGQASGPVADNAADDAHVVFTSPAIVDGRLPARYTCDGEDISPPMQWSGVPSTVGELVVFVLGLTPSGSGSHRSVVSVEWTLAGINPALHRLAAGELPPGAHVGRASDGKARYAICPAPGETRRYEFALYGIPTSLRVPASFVDTTLLREVASPESPTSASVGGAFTVSYTRR
ncbi:MAG TPA: hypothetical protein VMF09_01230 [Solirubrobacteraceae bacterium]|nr:hypothetical protein [Solirubrobacteraceae bacterium]